MPSAAVEKVFSVIGKVLSIALVRGGFAFVEMTTADADKALHQLNGHRLDGKALMIDEAHPRNPSRH